MKTPIEQFIDKTNDIRLSDEARARVRSNLVAYMRANPISAKPIQSPYKRFFNILSPLTPTLRMPVMALSLILVVTLGGATAFAATGALPGDTLYPLKVNVIEPVRGLLATSPEARARFHVSLAETRVEEVVQLASREQLTSEEGTQGRTRFEHSLKTARETINKLSQDDPEVAERIETLLTASLRKHGDDLQEIGTFSSSTNAIEAHSFAEYVKIETSLMQTDASTTVIDSIRVEPKNDNKKERNGNAGNSRQEESRPSDIPVFLDGMATSSTQIRDESGIASTTMSESDSDNSLKNSLDSSVHSLRNNFGL